MLNPDDAAAIQFGGEGLQLLLKDHSMKELAQVIGKPAKSLLD